MPRIPLFLGVLLSTMPCTVKAQVDFGYTTNGGTVTITGFGGPGGAVTIPSTIEGLPVTSIGDYAFQDCTGLTSITIPASVNSIGDGAFLLCTSLTSVTIPGSVTNIGVDVFSACYSLTNAIIQEGATTIENGMFENCYSLTTVTIPESVTSIGDAAFVSCSNLTNVTIPGNVTNIGEAAFDGCDSMTSVSIPASVTNIGNDAFFNCIHLATIDVDPQNSFYSSANGVLFDKNQSTLIQYPTACTAGSYVIPFNVTSIGADAFSQCYSLSSVTIPASVTNIWDYEFEYCTSLTSVYYLGSPGGFPTVGSHVFYRDYNTTVYYLYGNPFAGIPAVQVAAQDQFSYIVSGDCVAIVGYSGCCGGLTIPSTINGSMVTSIGGDAFSRCPGLTSVTIPGSISSVGDYAFGGCYTLTNLYFTGDAPALGSGVFLGENPTVYCLSDAIGWSSVFDGLPTVMIPAGSLQVNIMPSEAITAGALWQVDGGTWQNSGTTVSGLSLGNHSVVFSTINGWTAPSNETASVSLNSTNIQIGTYVQHSGSLQVTIAPAGAITAGALWQVDGRAWESSAATVTNLAVGDHTVTFNSISGWTAPASQTVSISLNSTTSANGIYMQEFGSLRVTIAPAGAITAGAQWCVDGGIWQNSGATISNLSVSDHTVAFSVLLGFVAPFSQTVMVNPNQTTIIIGVYVAPQLATATAIVTNGFVVAVTISDPGAGYTNTPSVYFVGGGGSGAQAVATVSNGIVTGITVMNAGFGYTNPPIVAVTPPYPLTLGVGKATCLVFTNLATGTNYQLQVSQSGIWENLGLPFTAQTGNYSQYFDGGINASLYRLVALPIPSGATAMAVLDYDFVIGATINDPGSGYVTVPGVQFAGGGGSGAAGTATLNSGAVTAITITNAGSGYTSPPTIQIDPPPVPSLMPTPAPAFRVDSVGLTAALTYQLQASTDLVRWTNYGAAFTATAITNSQYLNVDAGSKFFRLSMP
jgi:hypothetical protein